MEIKHWKENNCFTMKVHPVFFDRVPSSVTHSISVGESVDGRDGSQESIAISVAVSVQSVGQHFTAKRSGGGIIRPSVSLRIRIPISEISWLLGEVQVRVGIPVLDLSGPQVMGKTLQRIKSWNKFKKKFQS